MLRATVRRGAPSTGLAFAHSPCVRFGAAGANRLTAASTAATSTAAPSSLLEPSLAERAALLKSYEFARPPHYSTFYDFDAWVYGLQWPQAPAVLPMMGRLSVVADDIKFASNAWSLLRVCAFYGLPHPRVLSTLERTTPSMSPQLRGNWKFFEHCAVGSSLRPAAAKVALMPSHPKAVQLNDCDWLRLANEVSRDGTVEIVLGMENGMREDVCAECDAWLSIPQYGSCGSLSMLNALGIVIHSATSVLHPKAAQRRHYIGSTAAKKDMARVGKVETSLTSSASESNSGSSSPQQGIECVALAGAMHPPCTTAQTTKPHPAKITHAGLQHSSAAGHLPNDSEIAFLAAAPRDFEASRPHGDELLGLNDEQIGALLAERRAALPLQLATLHYNESGDRNIGAVIRNGNIYNFEKMIIVGRRKFSRRGSVGTHHYTNICFFDSFAAADAGGAFEGYALWALHNPFPYLCDRSDELLPSFRLPKELSVGRAAAKVLPSAALPRDHPNVLRWLAADAAAPLAEFAPEASWDGGSVPQWWEVDGGFAAPPAAIPSDCGTSAQLALSEAEAYDAERINRIQRLLFRGSSGDDAQPTGENGGACSGKNGLTAWERNHPMYGVVAQPRLLGGENGAMAEGLRPTVHLDDELSIATAVADVQSRGLRGIMLIVPEEGATPVWPELQRCERLVTLVHPARMCGVQRGITAAVSTSIALERLREATLMLKCNSKP